MPDTLLSPYEILLNQLKQEGKVQEKSAEESKEILQKMEQEMETFRFEKQRKSKASEEELSALVLTA